MTCKSNDELEAELRELKEVTAARFRLLYGSMVGCRGAHGISMSDINDWLDELGQPRHALAETSSGWPKGLQSETQYRIRSDMDPDARLWATVQGDGDVCLSIADDDGLHTVEFCAPGTGGGKSPRVHAALRQLANAIRLDAVEHGQ
jgi:hypothetical protein